MKKKLLLCFIVFLLLILGIAYVHGKNISIYFAYPYLKDFYGKHYNEVLHVTSFEDRKIAKKIMKIIDDTFIGKNLNSKHAGLTSYYNTACIQQRYNNECIQQRYKLEFISAKFNKKDGYLWIYYSNNSSHNILSRLKLNYIDGEWLVVEHWEHP